MNRIIESFADGISKGYRLIQNGLAQTIIPDPEEPVDPPVDPEPEPEPCSITKAGNKISGFLNLFAKDTPDVYRLISVTFYLTYSKDDGSKQRIQWSTDDLEATAAAWDALSLNSDGNIAFVFENYNDPLALPQPQTFSMSDGLPEVKHSHFWISGISTELECEPTLVPSEVDEGTTIYKLPASDFVGHYDESDGTISDEITGLDFTSRRSLLTIYTTDGDIPDNWYDDGENKDYLYVDFYNILNGEDPFEPPAGEQLPVNIFSCMESPMGQVMRMSKEIIPYYSGSGDYGRQCHAKYRVNGGEWVTWATESSSPVEYLFEQLYDPLTGNLLTNELTTSAFVYGKWDYTLRGVNENDTNFIASDKLISIEFEQSPQTNSMDLVEHWGGGFKIYSKGYKNDTMVSGTHNGADLGLPMKFSTENTMATREGALPIVMDFSNQQGEFRLLSDGILLADHTGPRVDNILVNSYPGDYYYSLTIAGGGKRKNNYELHTDITRIRAVQDNIYFEDDCAGSINFDSFNDKVSSIEIRSNRSLIEVPTVIPRTITDTSYMFTGCTYLVAKNIAYWDTSNVTEMQAMFSGCSQFNQPIGSWDVSNVTNMLVMLSGCTQFNQPLNSWNIGKVTAIQSMFDGCSNFNQPLNNWNTGSLRDAARLFKNAKLFNQDISAWNTSEMLYPHEMFDGAVNFNQDLSQWCATHWSDYDINTMGQNETWTKPRPVPYTCPRGENAVVPPEPIDGTGALIFTVTDDNSDAAKIHLGINIEHNGKPWQIYEDDVLICSDSYMDYTKVGSSIGSTFSAMSFYRKGNSTNQFKVFADSTKIEIYSNGGYNYNTTTARHIVIEQFSPTVSRYDLGNHTIGRLEVPNTIPPSVTSTNDMFRDCSLFNSDISNWDVSNITDMEGMFYNCSTFNQDLSRWNVVNITTKPYQFDNLTPEWTLPKPNWGVGVPPVITNSDFAFSMSVGALHPSYNWVSLTLTDYTNYNADYFELWEDDVLICSNSGSSNASISKAGAEVSTSSWITKITFKEIAGTSHNYRVVLSKPIETLRLSCTEGPLIDITVTAFSSNAATNALETNLAALFLPESLPAFMTSIAWLLSGCQNILTDIKGWDTSNITNMKGLFKNCNNFNQDISKWNVSNVTDMTALFSYCKTFNRDLSSWNVAKIPTKPEEFNPRTDAWTLPQPVWGTNGEVSPPPVPTPIEGDTYKFRYESKLSIASDLYLYIRHATPSQWVLRDTTTGEKLADYTGFAASGVVNTINYNVANQARVKIVQSANAERSYEVSGNLDKIFVEYYSTNLISSEGHLKVDQYSTNIAAYGYSVGMANLTLPPDIPSRITDMAYMFTGCYLLDQDITHWNTSNVTTMEAMFSNCSYFNQNIGNWNTSNVTTMRWMFGQATLFNQNLNLWDTTKVTSFDSMFYRAESFNGDISSWNTSSVTNMRWMFEGSSLFNQPIGNWNVSSVVNMSTMFQNCTNFNADIRTWNVSNATDMSYMFSSCTSFNRDLSGWNVRLIPSEPAGFSGSATAWVLPKPVWGTNGQPPDFRWLMVDDASVNGSDVTINAIKRTQGVRYEGVVTYSPMVSEIKNALVTDNAKVVIDKVLVNLFGSVSKWTLDANNNQIIYS